MTFKQFFATDKLLHAGACCAISLLVATLFFWTDSAIVIGALFGVAAGLGKEIYDVIKGGKFDIWDFAWDMIGAFGAGFCLSVLCN